MKTTAISCWAHLLICGLLASGLIACDTATGEIEGDLAVVEAFLFAGEPVDNIRVTSTIPFNSPDTAASPINDAELRLIKAGTVYRLAPRGEDGYYYYPGEDLTVAPGDSFLLEMDYLGQRISAATTVPPAPVAVALDSDVMEVPNFDIGVGRPPNGGGFQNNRLLVTWDNPDDLLHYVVVRGLQAEHEAIFPDFLGERIGNFRFISEPTREPFFDINLAILEGLGSHQVRVYRVNQEYADLYDNREQDSRDLNEPPDNIVGALGIFSAFNSVALRFEVKREE